MVRQLGSFRVLPVRLNSFRGVPPKRADFMGMPTIWICVERSAPSRWVPVLPAFLAIGSIRTD